MKTDAANYAEPGVDCTEGVDCANTPCIVNVDGVDTPNECCDDEIVGCTVEATNKNEFANTACDGTNGGISCTTNGENCCCEYASTEVEDSDGNTITVTYGCMNSNACNHVVSAEADCNVENVVIAGSNWVQNDDCCDMSGNSVCYLDFNYNGYYEAVDSTTYASQTTCNCGELGVGWVSGDDVADNMEVQGCTQFMSAAGDICPEYDPSANVDNGGCCLEEINWDDFANFDSSSVNFMDVYDVIFTNGMLNDAGDCVADTMMGMGEGPATAQITLGPPVSGGIDGQMQYFEEFIDRFSTRPEENYRAEYINDETGCQALADTTESDYWFCDNWGFDFEICEDLGNNMDCNQRSDCHWETSFCFPTFEGGIPCDQLTDEGMYECEENGCKWENDMCVFPVNEPWRDCEWLDEWECSANPNCESSVDFGGGEGDGNNECMSGCLEFFPDVPPADDDMAAQCGMMETLLNSGCMDTCSADVTDDFKMGLFMCDGIAEGYCFENAGGDGDGGDPGGGITNGCNIPDMSIYLAANGKVFYNSMGAAIGGFQFDVDGAVVEYTYGGAAGVAGFDIIVNSSTVSSTVMGYSYTDNTIPMGCGTLVELSISGVATGLSGIIISDSNGEQIPFEYFDGSGGGAGPQECLSTCEGLSESNDPDSNPTGFCEWITGLGPLGGADNCYAGCQGVDAGINCMAYMCHGCLDPNGPFNGDCSNIFTSDSTTTPSMSEKLVKTQKLYDSRLARGNQECGEGEVSDCADDDCCPADWIGDGFGDCQDQAYGCDLSCHNNDGGDCAEDDGIGSTICIPSDPCFDYDVSNCNGYNGCFWASEEDGGNGLCIPEPQSGPQCNVNDNEGSCNSDPNCQWIGQGQTQNEPAFCAPAPCQSSEIISDCEARSECLWEVPDWAPNADGVCYKHDPCAGFHDEQGCMNNTMPNCAWNWDGWYCYDPAEEQQGGGFCNCFIGHTKLSCDAIEGSNWSVPDWAEDCPDCDWVEPECWVPMDVQDCFHENDNPCSQFFGGGNEYVEWNPEVGDVHTCQMSFSFSDAGTWKLGENCLELNWDVNQDPLCSDDPLQTEDTCYCFDCQWDYQSGSCENWADGGYRTTEQAKRHDFQEMIYELSGSSGSGECMEYQLMPGGKIQLIKTDPNYGYCEIIVLTPATPPGS